MILGLVWSWPNTSTLWDSLCSPDVFLRTGKQYQMSFQDLGNLLTCILLLRGAIGAQWQSSVISDERTKVILRLNINTKTKRKSDFLNILYILAEMVQVRQNWGSWNHIVFKSFSLTSQGIKMIPSGRDCLAGEEIDGVRHEYFSTIHIIKR